MTPAGGLSCWPQRVVKRALLGVDVKHDQLGFIETLLVAFWGDVDPLSKISPFLSDWGSLHHRFRSRFLAIFRLGGCWFFFRLSFVGSPPIPNPTISAIREHKASDPPSLPNMWHPLSCNLVLCISVHNAWIYKKERKKKLRLDFNQCGGTKGLLRLPIPQQHIQN